jgi:hypothetical protein
MTAAKRTFCRPLLELSLQNVRFEENHSARRGSTLVWQIRVIASVVERLQIQRLDSSRSRAANCSRECVDCAVRPGSVHIDGNCATHREGTLAAIWLTMLTAEPDGLLLHALTSMATLLRTLSARSQLQF